MSLLSELVFFSISRMGILLTLDCIIFFFEILILRLAKYQGKTLIVHAFIVIFSSSLNRILFLVVKELTVQTNAAVP